MINFKTKKENQDFEKLDIRLRYILFLIAGKIVHDKGYDLIVTDTLRTKEEDDKFGGVGIHPTGRALDFNFCDKNHEVLFDDRYRDNLCATINMYVPYGTGRYSTILYHDVGFGRHFHLQVNPLGETKLSK